MAGRLIWLTGWELRPWRKDVEAPTWSYTGYTRQRENEEYEPRQLDYATGLPMEGERVFLSVLRRLYPRPMILPSWTMTQPMGTSPRVRAFLACRRASFIYFSWMLVTEGLLRGSPGAE